MSVSTQAVSSRLDRLDRLPAALIGVLAMGAALATGQLFGVFVGSGSSPVVAVGLTVVDHSPQWLVEFGKTVFYTYDKLALFIGMGLVILGLAAVAGLLSRSRARPGQLIILLFGALGVVAVFTRGDLGQLAVLSPLAALLAGYFVFGWLHRLALAAHADSGPGATGFDRRRFLVSSVGVAAGAGVVAAGSQLVGAGRNAETSRAAVGVLLPAKAPAPVPADADFSKLGTPAFYTPNSEFYKIDTTLVLPQVPAEDWTLRIHGMVDRELTLTYADIRDRPLIERSITLCCVSNEVGGDLISNAKFIGVDLRDLLNEAGVQPGAEQLFSTSDDGWTCGSPVSVVMEPDRGAMLAIGMNGEPLPLKHGFPARLVVPGLYGYVSATKWVTDIELTTWSQRRAYWLDRGWGQYGPVKTQSRIDVPKAYDPVAAGKVVVAGTAWAQHTGIARVEVRLDQGPWQDAELSAEVSTDTWRMWWIQLDVPAGSRRVTCRATDRSGQVQTEERVGTVPDGATGWHSVSFTAR